MKISGSTIVFSFDNHFEQMDVSLDEKNQEKIIRQNRRPLENRLDLPQVLVDRVSLFQSRTHAYQSNYSAQIAGKSSVQSTEPGDDVEYEQQSAMEQLIGGVIEKDVVINSIQRKEDIFFPQEKKQEANDLERATNPSQTRSVEMWQMLLRKTDIHFEEQNVRFSSAGEVTTEDGRAINFSLDMSLDRAFLSRTEQETLVQKWQERVNLTDPLVISLDGKAPRLSDAGFEFDLNADGTMEKISFVNSGSGFLAFDKNNDNIVNDGSELFGPGTGNGFGDLAAFDEDQNNWIDENDAVFSKLSVWTKDEKGKDRLISLKDAGIGAISLDYADTLFNMTQSDNTLQGQLKSTGLFLFENGNVGSVHQIDLALQAPDEINEEAMQLPQEETQGSLSRPGLLSLATVKDAPQPEAAAQPFKDLLDRIKKLKEEMGRLYEKMNPMSNQRRSRRSGQPYYQVLTPDASILFEGGRLRGRSRWV